MGDEFRLTTTADRSATLAAVTEALTGLGMVIWERGDEHLFADLPDADRSVTERWGGNVRVEVDESGLYMVINSGNRKQTIGALKRTFAARGIDGELEEL